MLLIGSYDTHKSPKSSDGGYFALEERDRISRASVYSDQHRDHDDSDTTVNITTSTGWNSRLILLLFNGILSTCWGLALCVFAWPGGILPAPDGWVGLHPAITNTIVALVATLSTFHITYIMQRMVKEYSLYRMAQGFTMSQLRWMYGVQTQSFFTRFPPARDRRTFCCGVSFGNQFMWIVTYVGFAIHTSSIVSIFQIVTIATNYPSQQLYRIPCGRDLSNLTLGVDQSLSDAQQAVIDSFSFNIGNQVGSYDAQVSANMSTSAVGCLYTKDQYGYGLSGTFGLDGGSQDLPGIQFIAQCADAHQDATSVWQDVFPDRLVPNLTTLANGMHTFTDAELPPQLSTVISDTEPFNITQGHGAMYALVGPSGSGALLAISQDIGPSGSLTQSSLVCSWKTFPKLIHAVQLPNSNSVGVSVATDINTYPPLAGRATLFTLQGMAWGYRQGAFLGETLYDVSSLTINPLSGLYVLPYPSSAILEMLLADGAKTGMTMYNAVQHKAPSDVSLCNSNYVETWLSQKFVDSHNLGWIAVVWTTGLGIMAVCGSVWFKSRTRVDKPGILHVADAFTLGRGSIPQEDTLFFVRDGIIVSQ